MYIMQKQILIIALIIITTITSCTHKLAVVNEENIIPTPKIINYLALGDSYTIGEDVPNASSFPMLLRTKLVGQGYTFNNEPKVIAKTGWTCADLLGNIEKENLVNNSYNLVSLLIGVNDQYRGYNINEYPARFTAVLQKAIDFAGSKKKVVVLSIPDYSVTPFGGGSQVTAKAISDYNAINKRITMEMGVKYVDITPISQKAKNDLTYLAPDKLHPSEKMYAEWVNEMLDEVMMILEE
jgi:lysophospholipase L1-like esterase